MGLFVMPDLCRLALWVLLSRVDRDRRVERSGFGYQIGTV